MRQFFVLQLGRKPVLLIGIVLMCFSHFLSATLILTYDLDNDATIEEGLNVSQKVAGYFVLLSVCIFLGSASISVG